MLEVDLISQLGHLKRKSAAEAPGVPWQTPFHITLGKGTPECPINALAHNKDMRSGNLVPAFVRMATHLGTF